MGEVAADVDDDTISSTASGSPGENVGKFVSTGRTGRRNALPDIMDEGVAKLSTGFLSDDLNKLSTMTSESGWLIHVHLWLFQLCLWHKIWCAFRKDLKSALQNNAFLISDGAQSGKTGNEPASDNTDQTPAKADDTANSSDVKPK